MKLKKVLSICLASVLTLSLVACGNNADGQSSSEDTGKSDVTAEVIAESLQRANIFKINSLIFQSIPIRPQPLNSFITKRTVRKTERWTRW